MVMEDSPHRAGFACGSHERNKHTTLDAFKGTGVHHKYTKMTTTPHSLHDVSLLGEMANIKSNMEAKEIEKGFTSKNSTLDAFNFTAVYHKYTERKPRDSRSMDKSLIASRPNG